MPNLHALGVHPLQPAPLQVRREVADTFRAAADCAGPRAMRQQLLQLAADAQAEWQGAGSSGSSSSGGWQQYECCLYAFNLVWARQRSQQREEEAAAEVRLAAEAVAAALQPAAPKLAGTALTLLGGMAEQLPLLLADQQPQEQQQSGEQQRLGEQQQQLPRLLALLLQLVQQPGDARLSRNAATCCWRLAGSRQLAAALAARHSSWGDALCHCFVAAGGMQQRARVGEDLTTAQFLLVSICQLATAAAAASAEGSATAEAGSELLQQLLSQPAAAADAALTAAAAAGGEQQHQQHLEQAALQVETIAVALEAVAASAAGSSSSSSGRDSQAGGLVQQLPRLLGSLGSVLHRAAASAAAAGAAPCAPQQALLLQAVCRVAAAVAATPAADVALDLLQPLVAAPQHPRVLQTLAELAAHSPASESSSGGANSGSQQRLQAAVSGSIQAAAAQHSSDCGWQPALLALGEACLQRLPAVAADAATLDALLSTAQHSMRSYHRSVCEQVVQFSEALCSIGCQRRRAGAAPAPAAGPAAAQHLQQLQRRLDGGGLGSALLLGLLLAAAGAMPPYMVVAIADALHRTWQVVGTDRCAWACSPLPLPPCLASTGTASPPLACPMILQCAHRGLPACLPVQVWPLAARCGPAARPRGRCPLAEVEGRGAGGGSVRPAQPAVRPGRPPL